MVTKQQALTANEFHENGCTKVIGPRGGVTVHKSVWRRNGQTKVWVRSPEDFSVPVKYGLKTCDKITRSNAHQLHTAEDCPLNDR